LRRGVTKKGATVSRTVHVLFVLALSACLISTSAEARRWRWRHFYGVHDYGHMARLGDDGWRYSVSEMAETGRARTASGSFGAIVDRLIRGCAQQAAELQNLPFDEITRIVAPDDAQRSALEALRTTATAEAQRLSAQCPQGDPAAPSARLEAVEQAIAAATATLAAVDPSLRAFYAALNDEQKARLLRDLTLSGSQAREGERAAERFKHRRRQRDVSIAAHDSEADAWAGICEQLTEALRGWPIVQIEHRVRLSEPQRVAFYELVSSSLKVADALARACPAETALTPPARMAQLRARLAAVRQATAAIGPAMTQFSEALNQAQKVHFAAMR
jgi:LTXXQ motif family protein